MSTRCCRRGFGKDINTPDAGVDLETGDKSYLLEAIKDERPRELGFELLGKDDIVRWGEFYDRMRYARSLAAAIPDSYTSSYYVNAGAPTTTSTAATEIWPIPTYELGVNRALLRTPDDDHRTIKRL